MLNAQFRPLDQWPGKHTSNRRDAAFRSTYPKTLDELEYELGKLGARDVVIQVQGLTLQDIRNDGWPRAGGWKNGYGGPGVVLSFESSKGAISMPCDKFRDWQDNLRAIAKSLEALRMVDRYGVTKGNEQYRGWTRLDAPPNGSAGMGREHALEFLAALSGSTPAYLASANKAELQRIVKLMRIEHHPDKATNEQERLGREEVSLKIGQAEAVLLGNG